MQLPNMTYILGSLLFSAIGFVAWRYGKKMERPRTKWLGLALMLYSYVAFETWILYLVGTGLCIALYVGSDE